MPSEYGTRKFNADILKMLGLLVMAIYILVSQVVAPIVKKSSDAYKLDLVAIAESNMNRISKLEAIVYKLEDIPLFVATQTEAISTLKISVDKLGEKLDRHINKEP